jgi:hypothetical protein
MDTRCSVCIMPGHLPGITTDDRGVCSYCRTHERRFGLNSGSQQVERRSEFERYLRRYRRKGRYECLVPVSGGKDSMYVLYAMVHDFGLRVLAYNFDNGFQSERARLNIQNAVKRLNVDLFTYKPGEGTLDELYRTFLLRAGEFCTPCNTLISAAAYTIAKDHGIRLIAKGLADRYSSGIEGVSVSIYADLKYYRTVIDGAIPASRIRNYIPAPPLVNAFRRLTRTGPETVNVMDYVHPGMDRMQEILETELGWQSPSGEFEHGDCRLNVVKDYLVNRRWGYSELTQALSSLVRTGEMSREEALRRAERDEVRTPPAVLEEFLTRIGVSKGQFEETRDRHFSAFPNYRASGLYRAGKKVIRLLKPVPSNN